MFPSKLASAGLAGLRAQLYRLFDGISAPALVSFGHLAVALEATGFVCPKGVRFSSPLLWTTQMEELWLELQQPYGAEIFGQILAGPSGAGKSHIAVLLAMRLFAISCPTLFISDAGTLVAEAIRVTAAPHASAIGATLDSMLFTIFFTMNADVLPLQNARLPVSVPLIRLLHESRAVVVIGEQGHAFNYLCAASLPVEVVFPLIVPNMYLGNRNARFFFAGSNLSQFEATLSRTYRPLLRFVRPLSRDDATVLLPTLSAQPGHLVTVEECDTFANFIPGEMALLLRASSSTDYTRERHHAMAIAINGKLEKIARDSFSFLSMLSMLDSLFQCNSMSSCTSHVSFLDLGLVYRMGNTYSSRAAPLCRPATLALIDLWRSASPRPRARLDDVVNHGLAFKQLNWDLLLTGGFSEAGIVLPCRQLGQVVATQHVTFKFTEYFTSSLIWSASSDAQAALVAELHYVCRACTARLGHLLYRCPQNCRDLDFLAFHNGQWIGFQTSIFNLTKHGTPDIASIQAYFGVTLVRYIFLTVNPETHIMLARRPVLQNVFQVRAADWIGM